MYFLVFDSNIELIEAFLFKVFEAFINYSPTYFNVNIEIWQIIAEIFNLSFKCIYLILRPR